MCSRGLQRAAIPVLSASLVSQVWRSSGGGASLPNLCLQRATEPSVPRTRRGLCSRFVLRFWKVRGKWGPRRSRGSPAGPLSEGRAGPAPGLQPEAGSVLPAAGRVPVASGPPWPRLPCSVAGSRWSGPAEPLASGGDAGSPWQGLAHSRCSARGKQLRSPHLHTEVSRPCRGTQSGFAVVEPSVSAPPSSPAVLVRTLVTGPGSPSPAARGKPGVGGESGEDLDCWRPVSGAFSLFS